MYAKWLSLSSLIFRKLLTRSRQVDCWELWEAWAFQGLSSAGSTLTLMVANKRLYPSRKASPINYILIWEFLRVQYLGRFCSLFISTTYSIFWKSKGMMILKNIRTISCNIFFMQMIFRYICGWTLINLREVSLLCTAGGNTLQVSQNCPENLRYGFCSSWIVDSESVLTEILADHPSELLPKYYFRLKSMYFPI